MNLFVSWSGEKSKRIAECLKQWIPSVIQAVKPFYSPDDISKGKLWSSEITSTLAHCNFGLIILTRENISEPWINFEAGALAKNLKDSSVIPLLFNLELSDLSGPLSLFQASKFDKVEFYKVLQSINRLLGEKSLSEKILEPSFEKWWPELESSVVKLLENEDELHPLRTDRDLLEEILTTGRRNFLLNIELQSRERSRIYLSKEYGSNQIEVRLSDDARFIVFTENGDIEIYDVQIERIGSASALLDWIFQIQRKHWCDPKVLFDFIEAVGQACEFYFSDKLQAVLCPYGDNNKIDWKNRTILKPKDRGSGPAFKSGT